MRSRTWIYKYFFIGGPTVHFFRGGQKDFFQGFSNGKFSFKKDNKIGKFQNPAGELGSQCLAPLDAHGEKNRIQNAIGQRWSQGQQIIPQNLTFLEMLSCPEGKS